MLRTWRRDENSLGPANNIVKLFLRKEIHPVRAGGREGRDTRHLYSSYISDQSSASRQNCEHEWSVDPHIYVS